jgi:hypothetical protein
MGVVTQARPEFVTYHVYVSLAASASHENVSRSAALSLPVCKVAFAMAMASAVVCAASRLLH